MTLRNIVNAQWHIQIDNIHRDLLVHREIQETCAKYGQSNAEFFVAAEQSISSKQTQANTSKF